MLSLKMPHLFLWSRGAMTIATASSSIVCRLFPFSAQCTTMPMCTRVNRNQEVVALVAVLSDTK